MHIVGIKETYSAEMELKKDKNRVGIIVALLNIKERSNCANV